MADNKEIFPLIKLRSGDLVDPLVITDIQLSPAQKYGDLCTRDRITIRTSTGCVYIEEFFSFDEAKNFQEDLGKQVNSYRRSVRPGGSQG